MAHRWIITIFAIGYTAIILEAKIKINKTASALLMAVLTWMFLFLGRGEECCDGIQYLTESLAEVAQIIFFLLGAMALVELIDSHRGFKIVTDLIQTHSKKKLLWSLGIFTFFLSALLDNLTTTIVIISLLKKLVVEAKDRMLFGAMVVIAANAGGAWSPIGDVTTTMLWIKGNITTLEVMKALFLPSFGSLCIALFIFAMRLKGAFPIVESVKFTTSATEPGGRIVFFCGIGALVFVPIFKVLTGLPPFMGMMISLGALWVITDVLHSGLEVRQHLRMPHILTRIDTSGILFFLGILLCIHALSAAGLLAELAIFLANTVHNITLITTIIGLISAVIDNVPLVAAGMGMYDLQTYPVDSSLWQLLSLCAGTGGSILIIGSAAGIAFMSLEKVRFGWYLREAGWIAFISYIAGIGIYLLQQSYITYRIGS